MALTKDSTVKLLLHCDGVNGSTTFTDSGYTGHTVTEAQGDGSARIDIVQSKFGGASALFDGDDGYFSIAHHADWFMDTGKFTIDCWVRLDTLDYASGLFYQETDSENKVSFWVAGGGTLYFRIEVNDIADVLLSAASAISEINTWYHVAVIRGWGGNANDWAITVDGTAVDTETSNSSDWPNFTGDFLVGISGTSSCNGWIDEFRVIKGRAAWTANFTPPTVPHCITGVKINVGDSWKCVEEMKINIEDSWKDVSALKINVGDAWKDLAGF